jgi:hypothetical protein
MALAFRSTYHTNSLRKNCWCVVRADKFATAKAAAFPPPPIQPTLPPPLAPPCSLPEFSPSFTAGVPPESPQCVDNGERGSGASAPSVIGLASTHSTLSGTSRPRWRFPSLSEPRACRANCILRPVCNRPGRSVTLLFKPPNDIWVAAIRCTRTARG